MDKKQQHPILFIFVTGITTILLLILLDYNPIVFFFIVLAVVGWNIGRTFRRRKVTMDQSEEDIQQYISQIDEMMKKG